MILLHTAKRISRALLLIATVPFFYTSTATAQPAPVLIFSPVVTSGLSSPVDVVNAGDGTNRLFIVERGGRVKIVSGGVLLAGNFLDIPDSISSGGERGLLSIAFHPNFLSNRYFFIYYTNTAGDIRISRFQTQISNPNLADENTGVVLLTIPHPSFNNHNGGKLNFGSDGNLYFGTGDGGSSGDPNNNAQNGNSLLGKIIRINVDNFSTPPYYTIPPDNPFISDPTVKDEIFNLGLRNPWRWSFDRLTHDVWVADVGQDAWEEVNSLPFVSSGAVNYGWRCYEGNAAYNTTGCKPQSSYVTPVLVYPHNNSTGGFAVTGGYVYRGTEFGAMYGYYICSDYISGNTWLIKPNGSGGWTVTMQSGLPGSIVGFGEGENGALYAISLTGNLYKVTTNSSGPLPLNILQFTATSFTGYNVIGWRTTNEQNLSHYEIEFSSDGINFTNAGRVNAINTVTENNYQFLHMITSFGKLFYRLKIADKDNRSVYSNIIELDRKYQESVQIYPTLIKNGQFNIFSDSPIEEVSLFSADGKKVFNKKTVTRSGLINIILPHLPGGIYFVRLKLKGRQITERIFIQ